MIKKRGFTLTELMVALAVLGVLTALVLPMINNNAPSRNRMMMKKAYYTIEDVVHNLINNEQYYPSASYEGSNYVGFDNLENTCTEGTCMEYNKFPKLFSTQLNVDGDISFDGTGSSIVTFKTTDGMTWIIMSENMSVPPSEITDIEPGNNQVIQTITVDVNGDKAPNCYQGLSGCSSRTKDFDQFRVYVTPYGKVIPVSGQSWFENAISIDSSVNGD